MAQETVLVTTPEDLVNLFLPGGWTVRTDGGRIVGFDTVDGFVPATTMELEMPGGRTLSLRFGLAEGN